MMMRDLGFDHMKFFPTEALGGAEHIKALRDPLPDIKFMPARGINTFNMSKYFELDNVFALSGTWLASEEQILNREWHTIGHCKRD